MFVPVKQSFIPGRRRWCDDLEYSQHESLNNHMPGNISPKLSTLEENNVLGNEQNQRALSVPGEIVPGVSRDKRVYKSYLFCLYIVFREGTAKCRQSINQSKSNDLL